MFFKKKIKAKEDVIKDNVLIANLYEKEIKNAIEGGNINILLGAGFTANIFSPLNDIEKLLTFVEDFDNEDLKDIIAWKFFKESILPMTQTKVENIQTQIEFFKALRNILSKRGNPVKNRQANIFTTNYDLVSEQALEYLNIDYNDGFKGKLNPSFSTANFGNILIKNMVFSNNKAEIESINLYKIHGSLTWGKNDKCEILNTNFLFNYIQIINDIFKEYNEKITDEDFENVRELILKNDKEKLKNVKVQGKGLFDKLIYTFNIVWPTKKKFYNTVLNMNYYELLRIFSNELEKNQSLLIVFGFSFNDEHILEIVKRSLSNPSLLVYVFCYKKEDADNIYVKFENCENFNNIKFIYKEKGTFDLKKLNKLLEKTYL